MRDSYKRVNDGGVWELRAEGWRKTRESERAGLQLSQASRRARRKGKERREREMKKKGEIRKGGFKGRPQATHCASESVGGRGERFLVLQPGRRAVPLRWESQRQDTGPQKTSDRKSVV